MADTEKKSDAELALLLAGCPEGDRWRHYKNGYLYYIVGTAIQEATQEPVIIYHRWNSVLRFVRPLREWQELVEWEGKMVPRFKEAD